jgi:hypothetical protein
MHGFFILLLSLAPLFAEDKPQGEPEAERDVSEFNLGRNNIGVMGYDLISYHNEEEPYKGKRRHRVTYQGVQYRFYKKLNRQLFEREPERFEPAYGGWCALAMAHGRFVPVDPRKFQIYEGRLFLFQRGAKKHWEGKEAGLIPRADRLWKRHLEEKSNAEARRPSKEYYDRLEDKCGKRESRNCCMAALERMEKGGYKETPGPNLRFSGCPEDTEPVQLRCRDSLRWCVPVGEKEDL